MALGTYGVESFWQNYGEGGPPARAHSELLKELATRESLGCQQRQRTLAWRVARSFSARLARRGV